uniref:Uncharacterized protein n=1 Tax=Oryza glumipatula TaxID=40148 RepID=A0A0E0BM30_9ORYZ
MVHHSAGGVHPCALGHHWRPDIAPHKATTKGEEGKTLFFVCYNPICGHRWREWHCYKLDRLMCSSRSRRSSLRGDASAPPPPPAPAATTLFSSPPPRHRPSGPPESWLAARIVAVGLLLPQNSVGWGTRLAPMVEEAGSGEGTPAASCQPLQGVEGRRDGHRRTVGNVE